MKTNGLKRAFSLLFQSKTGTFGLIIVAILVIMAVCAPLLTPHDPAKVNTGAILKPPFWVEGGSHDYLLGTDNLGRDMLSRIIYGSRVSLSVGFSAVFIAGIIGMVLGLISGFYGGFIDNILMRVVDSFLAIPTILFTLVILGVLGPSMTTLILVLGITNWVSYARVSRGEVLSVKEREYVKSAHSIGVRDPIIMIRHLLPNIFSSFIVIATLNVAGTIIAEASLSFLGLGIQPPAVSWGGMLSSGRAYLSTSWWVATFPGVAITITVLGIILFGDWLRDLLDPRSQGQKYAKE